MTRRNYKKVKAVNLIFLALLLVGTIFIYSYINSSVWFFVFSLSFAVAFFSLAIFMTLWNKKLVWDGKTKVLFAVLCLLVLLDSTSTYLFVEEYGPSKEANPLVRTLLENFNHAGVVVFWFFFACLIYFLMLQMLATQRAYAFLYVIIPFHLFVVYNNFSIVI